MPPPGPDRDRARGFDVGALEILVAERNVFPFFVLVAFDDLIPGDFLAGFFVNPAIANAGEVALVEKIEVESAGILRGIEFHGNVHQTEIDGAAPERPGRLLASFVSGLSFSLFRCRHPVVSASVYAPGN